jgi:hypothetical protein
LSPESSEGIETDSIANMPVYITPGMDAMLSNADANIMLQ